MAELNVIRTAEFIFPNIDAGATGRHVYYLLHSRGYKAKDVARILGCDSQAVYNWSYGSRMPSIDNLDRLSRLLNISINDLLVHDGDEEVTAFSGTKKIRTYLRRIITVLPPPKAFTRSAARRTMSSPKVYHGLRR